MMSNLSMVTALIVIIVETSNGHPPDLSTSNTTSSATTYTTSTKPPTTTIYDDYDDYYYYDYDYDHANYTTSTKPPTTTTLNVIETIVTSRKDSTDLEISPEFIIGEPDLDFQCGLRAWRVTEKITGGRVAQKGDWPWMALLGETKNVEIEGNIRSTLIWFCGGVLINTNWVLSAAHCTAAKSSVFFVRLGEYDHGDTNDDGQNYTVLGVHDHPNYNPTIKYYDITLLRIASITVEDYLRPVCLPWKLSVPLEGQDAWVTGWGSTSYGINVPGSSVLLEALVQIKNTKACAQNYSSRLWFDLNWPRGITEKLILCAAGIDGVDSCQGDSGGPLVIKDKLSDRFTLAGIVSSGMGCGNPKYPGLYIPVAKELLWIRQTAFVTRCRKDSDCGSDLQICFAEKCTSPCQNTRCGRGAVCNVMNRDAVCSCPEGFTGNPFSFCSVLPNNPCLSSPCAVDTTCKAVFRPSGKSWAQCKCNAGYEGNSYQICFQVV